MGAVAHDGVLLNWQLEGEDGRPVLVLSHSLGTDLSMWDAVVEWVLPVCRVLRLDTRGHGRSTAAPGPVTLKQLAEDVLAVMDAANVPQAAFCGLSLGGMIGQHLAIHHSSRLTHLILACTSGKLDPGFWQERAATVRAGGMGALVNQVMMRFFSGAFRARCPDQVASSRSRFLALPPEPYAACCIAISQMTLLDQSSQIHTPTLVINAGLDEATPPAKHGDLLARAIAGSRAICLQTGHLAAVEMPAAFGLAVAEFLNPPRQDVSPKDARAVTFAGGLDIRRQVLGTAWVERSLASRTAFNAEFQEFITRTAWGDVWSRPGLDHRTRRLLVIAITVALGQWDEFRLHVRAGLDMDGFTIDELKETLIQCAVYAGVPAGNTAFHHAIAILNEPTTSPVSA